MKKNQTFFIKASEKFTFPTFRFIQTEGHTNGQMNVQTNGRAFQTIS